MRLKWAPSADLLLRSAAAANRRAWAARLTTRLVLPLITLAPVILVLRAQAEDLLATAESRLRGLVALPHRVALEHARRFGVSAYDARFLAVAEKLRSPLVTEDARLRAAAPSLTRSIADALSRP